MTELTDAIVVDVQASMPNCQDPSQAHFTHLEDVFMTYRAIKWTRCSLWYFWFLMIMPANYSLIDLSRHICHLAFIPHISDRTCGLFPEGMVNVVLFANEAVSFYR